MARLEMNMNIFVPRVIGYTWFGDDYGVDGISCPFHIGDGVEESRRTVNRLEMGRVGLVERHRVGQRDVIFVGKY